MRRRFDLTTKSELFECMGHTWYKFTLNGNIYIQLIPSSSAVRVSWNSYKSAFQVVHTYRQFSGCAQEGRINYHWHTMRSGDHAKYHDGQIDKSWWPFGNNPTTVNDLVHKKMRQVLDREDPEAITLDSNDLLPGECHG